MDTLSVVVTTHNDVAFIDRALESVDSAIGFLHRQGGRFAEVPCEVVVVDDGSRDGTHERVLAFTAGRAGYKVLRSPQPRSPSASRNEGAAASRGSLLAFLDGDDRFRANHLFECYWALENGQFGFVKTQIETSDPVFPEWRDRIRNSIIINLCVRRACHEFVGGFPDYLIVSRQGTALRHEIDAFFKIEDIWYNQLLGRFFRGYGCSTSTVEYFRRPGNSFDLQYAKFQVPPGQYRDPPDQDREFRLKLCHLLMEYHVSKLEASRSKNG